jgi:hypothetical protein
MEKELARVEEVIRKQIIIAAHEENVSKQLVFLYCVFRE